MIKVLRNPYLWYLLYVATVTIWAMLALGSSHLESEIETTVVAGSVLVLLYLKIIGLV